MMIFHSPRGKKMSFWDVCNGDSESREKNFARRLRECSQGGLFSSCSDNVTSSVIRLRQLRREVDRCFSSLKVLTTALALINPHAQMTRTVGKNAPTNMTVR